MLRQSIKTFLALISIKTKIRQLGSRTCQVNHFFQHDVGKGCVASLSASKIYNFMEKKMHKSHWKLPPYGETMKREVFTR